jgi:hypothetical protein
MDHAKMQSTKISITSDFPIARNPDRWGRHYGLSRSSVYELINEGVIVARKLRGRTMIFDADNEQFRQRLPIIRPKTNGDEERGGAPGPS